MTAGSRIGFQLQLVFWLWLTVLFGTFAEALAEGRGKAQAASLRATKADLTAKRLRGAATPRSWSRRSSCAMGDVVLVETGDLIPADGEVDRGRRLGQRSRDHRRKRAGDPRGGRRPLGGDRGHARHLRPTSRSRVTRDPARASSTA